MPRTHPPYAAEYRRRIVELARGGRSITPLAREFEPTVETIPQWVKEPAVDEGLRSDGLTTTERSTGASVFSTFAVMVGGILPWVFSPLLFHNEMSVLLMFLMATNMIAGVLI